MSLLLESKNVALIDNTKTNYSHLFGHVQILIKSHKVLKRIKTFWSSSSCMQQLSNSCSLFAARIVTNDYNY